MLLLIAFLGGILTILSPCVLPVLPFVFARADQPFRKSGLPLLGGMVVTFALVASLATVGGGWAVRANEAGRVAALLLFAVFGLTLLLPSLAERLGRPFVRLGNRLMRSPDAGPSAGNSFLLGIGTGLLWAPCAGPILGLILTGAALGGASSQTVLLLLAYALGASTSLGLALLAGGRVFSAMKRSLGAEEWVRRGLGVAVLLAVAAVALGLDRGVLTRVSLASTAGLEQRLVDAVHPHNESAAANNPAGVTLRQPGDSAQTMTGTLKPLPVVGPGANSLADMPELTGATAWINTPALTPAALRGKVVLIDFWTYSCINCLRTLPYVKAWAAKYKQSGLVVIGVHTPEFPFEKSEPNVRKAIADLGVLYPVAMDNNYAIWRSFSNQYWPADYLVDAHGKIRSHHFGEGGYEQSEQEIRQLLAEADARLPDTPTQIAATGIEAASDTTVGNSPETYLGYERAKNFASPGGFDEDEAHRYRAPGQLHLNDWAFNGNWKDEGLTATLEANTGAIVYRFHARDLHLVLGPAEGGTAIPFRVLIDGKAPGLNHGVDVDAEGGGLVKENRLYQLVRQQTGATADHTFEIHFLKPGVQAFAFTFG